MALHRDIYWVGRQWAVTGYGLQACDQKQKSAFDIEAGQLWEEGALENTRAQKWLNSEDFNKGLEIARQRYKAPPRNGAGPPKDGRPKVNVLPALPTPAIAPLASSATPEAPKPETLKSEAQKPQRLVPIELKQRIAEIKSAVYAKRDAVEPPKPAAPEFHASFTASAKFVKPWHLRQKR